MYAGESDLHDIILMNESAAIYVCFPPDNTNPNHLHDYLCVSPRLEGIFGVNPGLSVGELVVFALVSAFEKKNIEIRDVLRGADSAADVVPTIRPSREVRHRRAAAPGWQRRRAPSARQLVQRRGRRNDSVHNGFASYLIGGTLTFENLPDKLPPRPATDLLRLQSLNDELYSSMPDTSPANPISLTSTVTLTIVRIVKSGVAVVTDGQTQFVAKVFPRHSDPSPYKPFAHELAVYAACAGLQGVCIPYLYAVGHVPEFDTSLLLLEFVGSGTTIANVITKLEEADDMDWTELENLETEAVTALQALHQQKVVHRDIAGRNMVLNDGGGIVMIDFGAARVIDNDLARFRSAREADEAGVRAVFHLLQS